MTIQFKRFLGCLLPAALLGLSAAPADIFAQTSYSCRTQSGMAYRSSTPCPRSNQPQGMISYGPTERPQREVSRPPPKIERAGEEIGYMSAKCATMQDGIRTGPARGLSRESLQEARNTFNRECGEERRRASRQLRDDQRQKEKLAKQEEELAQKRKFESAAAEERFRSQCAEMRISIRSRKQRANPTEGELRDLALFESRYEERCGG